MTYIPSTSSVVSGSLNVSSFTAGKTDVQTVSGTVYLNQFDVPTQDFDRGFLLPNGNYLDDNSGNLLVQYFSLQAAGGIQLGGATAGYYQFALLSDDGAVFSMSSDGGSTYKTIVNDDGNHSNAFVCASAAVKLGSSDVLPYKLNWFQGPKYRISLMLMWRYVGASTSTPVTSDCSTSVKSQGDTYYFTDSSNGTPTATSAYQALLNAGWSVVPSTSFVLPSGTSNPCTSD